MKQNQIEIEDDRHTEQVSAHQIQTVHTSLPYSAHPKSKISSENMSESQGPSGISFSQFQGMSYMYEKQTEKSVRFAESTKSIPVSKKSIKSQSLIDPPMQSKSPQIDFVPNIINVISQPNICLSFDYKNITQSAIFTNFLQFTKQRKFELISSSANKLSIKRQIPFYKKILKVCFPHNLSQNQVYQFRKSSTVKGRIKLQLISGQQIQFQKFWKQYNLRLWKQGYLECSLVEDIKYFLLEEENQNNFAEKIKAIAQVKAKQAQLWNKYDEKLNEQKKNMGPVVERLFMNQFYDIVKVNKIIGESQLGEKIIGDLQRKKMIIKGSMNLKQILGFLQLKDDLSDVVKKLQTKQIGKIIFPKSVQILNNLTAQKIPSPYQWETILCAFEHTLKEQTKQYNKTQVKDIVFDAKLLNKLLILLLVQAKNREIWGIIQTLTVFYAPDPCPQHITKIKSAMTFLQNEWEI